MHQIMVSFRVNLALVIAKWKNLDKLNTQESEAIGSHSLQGTGPAAKDSVGKQQRVVFILITNIKCLLQAEKDNH